MKWYEATVYERVQVGTDATRNPITELAETDTVILVRTAPMAPRHDATEGNQFDIVERTFLTKAQKSLVEGAAALMVGGELYEVEHVAEWGDPIAIRVKRCK
jgi:hypothetical protein